MRARTPSQTLMLPHTMERCQAPTVPACYSSVANSENVERLKFNDSGFIWEDRLAEHKTRTKLNSPIQKGKTAAKIITMNISKYGDYQSYQISKS